MNNVKLSGRAVATCQHRSRTLRVSFVCSVRLTKESEELVRHALQLNCDELDLLLKHPDQWLKDINAHVEDPQMRSWVAGIIWWDHVDQGEFNENDWSEIADLVSKYSHSHIGDDSQLAKALVACGYGTQAARERAGISRRKQMNAVLAKLRKMNPMMEIVRSEKAIRKTTKDRASR
jgi:hypothetical protein